MQSQFWALEHPLAETEWQTVFLLPADRGIKDAETVWRDLAGREPLVCAREGAAVRSLQKRSAAALPAP